METVFAEREAIRCCQFPLFRTCHSLRCPDCTFSVWFLSLICPWSQKPGQACRDSGRQDLALKHASGEVQSRFLSLPVFSFNGHSVGTCLTLLFSHLSSCVFLWDRKIEKVGFFPFNTSLLSLLPPQPSQFIFLQSDLHMETVRSGYGQDVQ